MATRSRHAAQPRRQGKRGGYACGDQARTRIVLAAAEVFATEGYRAASTRRIAAAAGVNTQALHYYFGGKAGLHNACARQCCDWFEDGVHVELSRARQVVESRDAAAAMDALRSLLAAMLEQTQADKQAGFWSHFLGRLQYDKAGPAVATVQARMVQSLFMPCSGLTALIKRRAITDAEVRLAAMVLIALPAAFSSAHGGALWKAHGKLSKRAVATMVMQMFDQQVLAAINGPVMGSSASISDRRPLALVLPLRRAARGT
jgi:TetR/AcrR family transcriptional regulator, regulator of cefoperazone and chloramphenicol sensitivity